jgi:hypothetical protein
MTRFAYVYYCILEYWSTYLAVTVLYCLLQKTTGIIPSLCRLTGEIPVMPKEGTVLKKTVISWLKYRYTTTVYILYRYTTGIRLLGVRWYAV